MSKLFPELDLPDYAPAAPARAVAVAKPIAAGSFGRPRPAPLAPVEALARALAIPAREGHPPVKVRAIDAIGAERRVRIELEGGGWPELSFYVVPRGEGEGIAHGEHLTFILRGSAADRVSERILRHCASRLRKTPWASLYALAGKDPNAEAPPEEGVPMPGIAWPPNDLDVEYLESLGFGYSPPGAWRNFLVGHENNYGGIENARGYCHKVSGKVVGLSHTEIECRMSTPTGGAGSLTFWNHVQPDHSAEIEPPGEWMSLFTDLNEIDVIKGGHDKLDRMLESLLETGEMPDAVVLTSTCTTTVIGDDTVGAIERLKAKRPLRVINMSEGRDVTLALFDQARASPGFHRIEKVPRSINLVGLPRLVGQLSLLEMLREAGVTVSTWILPDVRPAHVDRFMAAELTVLYDWPVLDRAYEHIFAGLPITTIRPPPPIGIEGTRAWLASIGEALGVRREMDAVFARHHEKVAPAWSALVRRARQYRLGFIGEERLLGRYFSQRNLFGIAVLELLEEMGFGIDLHLVPAALPVHTPGAPPALPVPRIQIDGARRVIWTGSPEELERDLERAEAVAFYSEIFFDRRLSRTGRNLFSVREIGRLGLEGALDALKRMLRACELPFFRTYGQYFGSPFSIGPGR